MTSGTMNFDSDGNLINSGGDEGCDYASLASDAYHIGSQDDPTGRGRTTQVATDLQRDRQDDRPGAEPRDGR